MIIFTIAWRNIFRHKGKTIVIGSILFLGALIMTLGNGIISGMNQGMAKNIVDSFTGDAVIISKAQQTEDVLASMAGQTMEPITDYPKFKKGILAQKDIEAIMPAVVGYVWVLNETGQPIDQYVLGVNFSEYQKFFPNSLKASEGRLLKPNEKGVLVSSVMQKFLFDYCNYWAHAKDVTLNINLLTKEAKQNVQNLDIRTKLIFMGLSRKNSTLDIASDVIGVIKFRALNSILGFYSILDIESLRECLGYFTAESTQVKFSSSDSKILNNTDNSDHIEALFSDHFVENKADSKSLTLSADLFTQKETKSKPMNWEEGVFNTIFVKLKPNANLNQAVQQLNTYFEQEKIPLKTVKWDKAIGMLGQMAMIMKAALFLFVAFIFFVAIFIIMNTLSMAAMERISEIGMMRAVGARKMLIAKMFLAETLVLSGVFGGAGILMGMIAVKIVALLHISTQNEMLQIFYGGDVFHPILSMTDILLCVLQLGIVTLLAVIYPLIVARRITPLDAITRD